MFPRYLHVKLQFFHQVFQGHAGQPVKNVAMSLLQSGARLFRLVAGRQTLVVVRAAVVIARRRQVNQP